MALPLSNLNTCDTLPKTSPKTSLSINVNNPIESTEKVDESDISIMTRMGYEQELKRGFSGLMSFTFCFTVVSVFASLSIGLDFGLNTGGSGKPDIFF